jgi:hypothetical protein
VGLGGSLEAGGKSRPHSGSNPETVPPASSRYKTTPFQTRHFTLGSETYTYGLSTDKVVVVPTYSVASSETQIIFR